MRRIVYVFLLGILSTGLFAQQRMVPLHQMPRIMAEGDSAVTDATISAYDVYYWVGKGEHQIIMAVNWAAPDTALAWGFRFTAETITMDSVMKAITATDPRFSYETDTNGYIADIRFALNDAETLELSQYSYWWMNLNGKSGAGLSQQLKDGDFAKWGDAAAGVVVDSMNYGGTYYPSEFAWTKKISSVFTPEPDATIDASAITYWVGEGDHQVIMAVNWAAPDTALAWGFRFSSETITMDSVMKAIAAADARFAFSVDTSGYIADITFVVNENETLQVTEKSFWWMNLNGYSGAGLSQQLKDGDFAKWGDPAAGFVTGTMEYGGYPYPMGYVWTTRIHPVGMIAGVPSFAEAEVRVYPNPASDYVCISCQSDGAPVMVTLADMQGRVLVRQQISEEYRMPVSGLAAGVYLLRVQYGNSVAVKKIQVR